MTDASASDGVPTGIVGPVAGTVVPRFAGSSTFARLPRVDEVSDYAIAVLGAPFDGGTSFRPGARFGPSAVRQASRNLRPAYHPDLDVSPYERLQVVDAGDVPCNPYSIDEALQQIDQHASDLLSDRHRLITVGGDHTVALPLLRAVNRVHGPVALVHFDAHLDTWDTYFGASNTHGTVFRRAFEEGLLIPDHSIHVGTRGPLYSRQDLADDTDFGFQVVRAGDLDLLGIDGVLDRIRTRVGDAPVYLSIDIDVLDPAFAPGTGTPEIGGFTSRELLHLLRGLSGELLVAADVVEVSPAYDHAEVTSLAAATVVYDITSLMAASGRASVPDPAGAPPRNP
ncbi:agmatinase [Actinacidiphila oryziradicis]|uniref:Agmatinase n=1 Tax=Actinacidiphila oryziradicis TaxID=2571141 RepID=A0A4U0SC60_9ACTN|nr:agmatinase [Actinacidiphila oryziradicis]TJZ97924.1 agmatinase [Actinacidiphila oryziradicis]